MTAHAQARLQGYGLASGSWRATSIEHGADGVSFRRDARRRRTFADVTLAVSGEYNVRNALAVMAAAAEQGLTPPRSARASRRSRASSGGWR